MAIENFNNNNNNDDDDDDDSIAHITFSPYV